MPKRTPTSRKLQYFYSRNIKCPYCKNWIRKFVAKCDRCGVTKEQIADASNQEAKQIKKGKRQGKIVYTRRRPDDVSLPKLLLLTIFLGVFGAHCFYVGRRLRGWLMLGSFLLLIAAFIIFPTGTGDVPMHAWREPFQAARYFRWFPLDAPGFIVVMIWLVDWVAILIDRFKFPVRLADSKHKSRKAI